MTRVDGIVAKTAGKVATDERTFDQFVNEQAVRLGYRERWVDEGLAEARDELDGREEDEAEERLLTRLGMSEYYGSEGFDRPPSDVYSYGGGYFGDDGAGA